MILEPVVLVSTPCQYDEKALLAKVSEGDEFAFRQLFLHWHQQLAGYIYRITESKELTEEIVQEVFMKIWMIRETVIGIDHFRSFLLVVGRNKTYDVLKKLSREKELRRAWEEDNRPGLSDTENEDQSARFSLIDQAIDRLPPRRKEIFLLSRRERLSYKEIAAILDISPESVKTHLKLASRSITEYIRANWAEFALLAMTLPKIF